MTKTPDTLHFLIPGDLDTLTGGYRYDKRMVQGLRALGRTVTTVSLGGNYPQPNARDLAEAESRLADLPDDSLTLIDGLAAGVLQQALARHAQRLRLVALVHHPLAMETGLSAEEARTLLESERQALAHVQRIITTSETTALSLGKFSVPSCKVLTVCPGTDSAELAQGSNDGRFRLLCVATLTRRKGHSTLLQALSRLRELPWQLVCAGSHERDRQTASAISLQVMSLDLQTRVDLLGEVDEQSLARLYLGADLFVLPSFHEGYGMVLDEAIARGLPIVASDAGAIASTVPAGAGLFCPPGDADALAANLRRFMEDSETRQSLISAARQARLGLRSWEQAATEFNESLPW